MKKAIYKILTPVCAALMLGMILTSCSNKMESLAGTRRLLYAQSVDKPKTETNKTTLVAVDPLTNSCALDEINPVTENKSITTGAENSKTEVVKNPFNFTHPGIHKRAVLGKVIQKQFSSVKKQIQNAQSQILKTPAASYKHTDHTQGLLGAAILFLILGVILVFLGFDVLGSLFWIIGVILFVAAIIFFILWLLASAV